MSLSIRSPRSGCPATMFQSSQLASPAPANNNIISDRDHDEEQDAAATTSPTKNVVPSLGAAEDLVNNINSLTSSDAAHNLLSIKSTIIIDSNTTTTDVVVDVVAPKSESRVRETVADENMVAASSIVSVTTTTVEEAPVDADVVTTADMKSGDDAARIERGEEAVVAVADVAVADVTVADTVISQKDEDESSPITATAHLSSSFTTAAGVPILLFSASVESTDVVTRRPFASPRLLDTTSNDAVITSHTTPSKSTQCHHNHNTPSAPTKPAREVDCACEDDDESSAARSAVCIRLFASDTENMEAELPLTAVTSTFTSEGSQEVQRTAARRELFPNTVAAIIGSKRSRSETPTPQIPDNSNNMVHDDSQKNSSYHLYPQHSTTTTTPLPNNNNDILPTLSSCANATAANSTTGAADAHVMDDEDHPTPLLAPAPDNDDVDVNVTDNIDITATDSLVHPPLGFSVGGRPIDDDVKFVMETSSKGDEAAVVVAECPTTTPSTTKAQDVIEGPCGGADVDVDDDVEVEEEAALLLPTE